MLANANHEKTTEQGQATAKRVVRVRKPRTGLAKGMVVRVYPTEEQAQTLLQWMGACRWVWNWALAQQNDHYTQTQKHLSLNTLSRLLTQAMAEGQDPVSGREISWLREVPRTCLTQAFRALGTSWAAFFDGVSGKRADQPGKPTFKAFRDSKKSIGFQVDPRHQSRLDLEQGTITVPGLGKLQARFTEAVPGDLTALRVSRQGGQWLVSLALVNVPAKAARRLRHWEEVEGLSVSAEKDPRVKQFDDPRDPTGFAALDASIPFGAVATSDGKTTYSLATLRDRERTDRKVARRKHYQRRFSRAMAHRQREAGLQKGQAIPKGMRLKQSKRQRKLADQIAKIDRHLKDARQDRTHKFTTELVRNHHTIAIETLSLTGMAKAMNRHFRRRFHEANMGEVFRQLEYKCEWHERTLIRVDRWFPSSKRCSTPACHQKNQTLKLSERAWVCPHCSTVHERDDNAAFNLWQEGQRLNALLLEENLSSTPVGSTGAARQAKNLDLRFESSNLKVEAVSEASQTNVMSATVKPMTREPSACPETEGLQSRMERVCKPVG